MGESIGIASLGVSPLKSGRYQAGVESLAFEQDGTFGDREYMLVEAEPHVNVRYHKGEVAEPGHFLSQREDPVIGQIQADLDSHHLKLSFDGQSVSVSKFVEKPDDIRPVSVWGWQGVAVDQGDYVAGWASEIVERPVRLVRRSLENPRFVEGKPGFGVVGFADGFPMLVTSTASVDAVNDQLAEVGKEPISVARFRPNIVLEAEEREPFFEDEIESFTFTTNNLVWRAVRMKPCGRCIVVDRDPETGAPKPGVQKALAELGRKGTYANPAYGDDEKIFLGQNFTVFPPLNAHRFVNNRLGLSSTVSVTYAAYRNWVPTA